MEPIDDINSFRIFNRLKSVYRFSSVDDRKESSAEHTWGTLMLADFFLSRMKHTLDRLKVYDLLLYHDVVEIEAGDTPLHPQLNNYHDKEEREKKACALLTETLPQPLNEKFNALFHEFEARSTPEAQFAKAIDALESEIHEMDYKEDWKGWSKEFLVSKKKKYMKPFPELDQTFDRIIDFLETNGYFEQ